MSYEKNAPPPAKDGDATNRAGVAGCASPIAYNPVEAGKDICADLVVKLQRAMKARDAANRRVDRLAMGAVVRLVMLLDELEKEVRHEQ